MSTRDVPQIGQPGMPTPKESDILRQCRDCLRLRGWLVYRMQQGLGAHRGFPDLVAVRAGQVLFIEVKTPRGRLSRYQEQFRDEITEQGCTYLVVRSVEDIIGALEAKAGAGASAIRERKGRD